VVAPNAGLRQAESRLHARREEPEACRRQPMKRVRWWKFLVPADPCRTVEIAKRRHEAQCLFPPLRLVGASSVSVC